VAVQSLGQRAETEIRAAGSMDELRRLRTTYLGRKNGELTLILRRLPELAPDDRRSVGAEANRLRTALTELFAEREAALAAPGAEDGGPDLTMPGRGRWPGALHPVTLVVDDVCSIFREMGFTRVVGPEAETEYYNFTALNFPHDHPAADIQDSLYLGPGRLLRTHTSPVQIRTMEHNPPPIRVVVPGRVYRRDAFDASHAPAFTQIEGLAVDEGISMVDLKTALAEFARRLFGPATRTRFRPGFFPFTEPSVEVDVSCTICAGDGCSACKQTGWMEIMGAGMVHPNVFRHAGIDAERFTGWAFGMGADRIAMLRYGIPDIRLLFEGDVRFLQQFAREFAS
jgi:phenylalanyl-tRNA synthetase alpha chain